MAKIVKEGWLMKRGEYIKNWRARYFQVYEDGRFWGYKEKPRSPDDQPQNKFSLTDCAIQEQNRGRYYIFTIRCFQMTSLIERKFSLSTSEEREEWTSTLLRVYDSLHKSSDGVKPTPRSLEEFELLKLVGHGSFGRVILAREKRNGEPCAIKVLKKDLIKQKNEVTHTVTEARVLNTLKHPFLTELKYLFQTKNYLCMVMEYVIGGDMFGHLRDARIFSEERVRFYGAEICVGIGFLHSNNVIYRDLKLENLLLDLDGHIRITDFGLCKENISYDNSTRTFCGTPEYLAPELVELDQESDYGRAVDWWSVGVVLYEMLCGNLPFRAMEQQRLFRKIAYEPVAFPEGLSPMAASLLQGFLCKDARNRLGGSERDVEEIKEHPFFSSIDWGLLEKKQVTPPFKPKVSGSLDTSNFDEEFTCQEISLTPTNSEPDIDDEGDDPFASFDVHVH